MSALCPRKRREAPPLSVCVGGGSFTISNEDAIYPDSLSMIQGHDSPAFPEQKGRVGNLQEYLQQLEYRYIKRAYEKYGNVRDAAKSLGMSAPTLTRKKNRGEQNYGK